MKQNDSRVAEIKPNSPPQKGRVLSSPQLILQTASMFALSAGWGVPLLLGGVLSLHAAHRTTGAAMIVLAFAWLLAAYCLLFLYPEWPHNLRLCGRLRRKLTVDACGPFPPLVSPLDPETRMVEWVPRDRWQRVCLDTAVDLMVMKVESSGIRMQGDHHRFDLPASSILQATVESVRPRGWFCKTHIVVLHVQASSGVIELPISYRDHSIGSLSSRKRREVAETLADQISGIARGVAWPDPIDRSPPPRPSLNPYAAPAIV